jgi:hypothetical protein
VQESLKSELWLQRYDKRNFGDLFVISGKWLGLYLELISKIRGASWKSVDCGLISNKYRGFFVKWQEFLGFGIIFQWEKLVDSVHGSVDHAGVAGPRFHCGLHSG